MKKITLLLLLMIFGSAAFAQIQKTAVVVAAVGAEPDSKGNTLKALESEVQKAFVKDGRYTAVTRDAATLAQIDMEHIFQRNGAVDESQIKELGRMSGAKYLCAVKSIPAMGSFMLEATLVDIESANIISMGSTPCDLVNFGDLIAAGKEIVRQLLNPSAAKQSGDYGSGIFWDKESVQNAPPVAAELIRILKQKINTTEGTCVGGVRIAVESDKEPECSEGMTGATCTAKASLIITHCEGNKKTVLKGSLVGMDNYSVKAANKQLMRNAESAGFWKEWVVELEARAKK